MKTEAILFLLSIHEGNELRDQLPSSAYDDLAAAGLLDGTDITEKGYAYVRHLEGVALPVQMWVDPRHLASTSLVDARYAAELQKELAKKSLQLPKDPGVKVDIVLQDPEEAKQSGILQARAATDDPPAGYRSNPGQIPGGVDRAADIQIVRANGKRKTLPAQSVNWADDETPDRVIGWRYAAAAGEARIHTPGETMPAPDA